MKEMKIGRFEECEHDFMRDNEYIHGGYRINFNSCKRIFQSLFMKHNETVNIWSHFIGLVVFISILTYSIYTLGALPEQYLSSQLNSGLMHSINYMGSNTNHYEELHNPKITGVYSNVSSLTHNFEGRATSLYSSVLSSRLSNNLSHLTETFDGYLPANPAKIHELHEVKTWPILIFLISAMLCMAFSSTLHLFNAHSLPVNKKMAKLDYAGISFLISGSFYPPIYYTFYCHASDIYIAYIVIYLFGISFASILIFSLTFIPGFKEPKMRAFRGIVFLGLALLGVIPVTHSYYLEGAEIFLKGAGWNFIGMGGSYLVGVVFYVSRVPERFYPGSFDFIGHSHNIWHCFVVLAALFHYFGSLEMYFIRSGIVCRN